LISAQISLDHGELARTLAAHLPEMQAKLGGNQAIDVRIGTNGQGAGLGAGTSGGMFSGSTGDSRGGRQQPGNAAPSYSAGGTGERANSIAEVGMATGEGRLNARLDITI
jgi:hypothetical protein